ncbi:MAG: hypothetical protein HYU99_09045 [Deltaproteobacteria bacterium]|nr:hypothetical protein [Deltaproteobacteria bacterium]
MTLDSLFGELRQLQTDLQQRADRLRAVRKSIALAYSNGHGEADFLPRRLMALKNEEEIRFEGGLARLKGLLAAKLERTCLLLTSQDDVKTVVGIRKTIRYIRNAFAGELAVTGAAALTSFLPDRRGG